MGLEANCTLRVGRRSWTGAAHLEDTSILFRGADTRVVIPFTKVLQVDANGGTLSITHADGLARFVLGPAAPTWAAKIRNPRSLLDKLGVKPGMRVAVVRVDDPDFRTKLLERTVDVVDGPVRSNFDLVFYGTESARGLSRLGSLRRAIKPNGAIWVVHRKGKEATLRDVEVFAAAKAVGLVDTKVVSFSTTHTAEKLVIPVNQRTARG
jgi:hypothetical protein